jgi:hypothetical protein
VVVEVEALVLEVVVEDVVKDVVEDDDASAEDETDVIFKDRGDAEDFDKIVAISVNVAFEVEPIKDVVWATVIVDKAVLDSIWLVEVVVAAEISELIIVEDDSCPEFVVAAEISELIIVEDDSWPELEVKDVTVFEGSEVYDRFAECVLPSAVVMYSVVKVFSMVGSDRGLWI